MLTLTRQGLLLSLSATVIPSQGSSDVPVSVTNDQSTYVGYTLEPRVGYYLNGIYKSTLCPYDTSAKTFSVPAEAFNQNGVIDITLALIDNTNANHIETCQTVHATVNKAPLGTVVLPDQTTWQDYVNSYVNQLFDSNYKPQFDQIQQDLENLVTEAQQQQQTAEQQQTQIDNAISVMGEYQIVSNDPVQIQFKQGDGTFGPTVDLGDGLASKSMVNAGYYQSIGSQYSGSASDYGIQVEEIVGAYYQGLNPSPDNPQEMQAVEISELHSVGKNLFSGLVKGKGINSITGAEQVGDASACSDYIPVKAGQEYYISGLANTINSFIAAYDYEKNFIGRTSGEVASGRALNNTTLLAAIGTGEIEKLAYLRVTQYVSIDDSGTIDDVDGLEIMLNVGDTAEPYTPYTGADTVTLSEPLILRALPNGTCDVYDRSNTDKVKRWVYEDIFNGSDDESWTLSNISNTNTVTFTCILPNQAMSGIQTVLCDKFVCIEASNNDIEHCRLTGDNPPKFALWINRSRLSETSVSGLRTYLQSNPITVWYELAEPTTEPCEIPRLQSFYPYTNAWCDSIVQPQITWNVLTGKSSILDGNGNLIQQGYMTPQDNLLINSDFRSGIINQKGKTSYIGTSSYTYTIDMWRQVGYIQTSVFSDYIRLETLPSNPQPVYFEQVLSKEVNEDCVLAIKVKNVSGDVVVAIKGTTNKNLNITKAGVFTIQNTSAESVFVQLKGTTSYVEIEFIKLEKGKYFTGMPVWNLSVEILKCQRYLFSCHKISGYGFETGGGNVYIYVNIPTPMQKQGTVSVNSTVQVIGDGSYKTLTISSVNVSSQDNNLVILSGVISEAGNTNIVKVFEFTNFTIDSYYY